MLGRARGRLRACIVAALLLGCARPAPVVPKPSPRAASELTLMRAVQYEDRRYASLRLRFVGNAHAPSAQLARELSITHGLVDRELLDHDALVLAAFYYDRGFLDVKLKSSVLASGSVVTVTFAIEEGEPYRVRSIAAYEEVAGKRVTPLGWSTKLSPGDIFCRAALLDSVNAVRRAYRDLGFAYVEADPEFERDQVKHELTVRLPVRRGVVTYFERIDIVGAQKLALDVIRGELLVKVGDRYNETALEATKKKLVDSAWFSRVDLATTAGSAKNQIILSVEVEERPSSAHGEVALAR